MQIKFDKILQVVREGDTPTHVSESSKLTVSGICETTANIGDAVYLDNDGVFKKASALTKHESRIIGFVQSKSNSTTCKIISAGMISGMTGLETGKDYFLSETHGLITTTIPTASGSVVTHIGKAFNSTTLMVGLSNVYTIRS